MLFAQIPVELIPRAGEIGLEKDQGQLDLLGVIALVLGSIFVVVLAYCLIWLFLTGLEYLLKLWNWLGT